VALRARRLHRAGCHGGAQPTPLPGRRVWALEGTGCYGAGLTRLLVDQGEWVVEIDRPTRPRGRHGAKSDALDAIRAGREALARQHYRLLERTAMPEPGRRVDRAFGHDITGQG
jgi:hypothetical protein